jgi:hypothetical protein
MVAELVCVVEGSSGGEVRRWVMKVLAEIGEAAGFE